MHIHEILGWHWGMWIFFIIFWLFIVLGIVAIVRWFNAATRNKESALEILEKRYAKGEISKEDYEMKKEEMVGGKD
jgi:putative membrane protein